jgi:hypothetical protein
MICVIWDFMLYFFRANTLQHFRQNCAALYDPPTVMAMPHPGAQFQPDLLKNIYCFVSTL